jgi:hypothetical protein
MSRNENCQIVKNMRRRDSSHFAHFSVVFFIFPTPKNKVEMMIIHEKEREKKAIVWKF